MLLIGRFPHRFVMGFEEKCFQRISLEVAYSNGVLQLFLLTVNAIVSTPYQSHLTCIKD